MAKVLLLACGFMGGGGLRILQHLGGISKVTCTDIDYDTAKNLADELDFPEVEAMQFDITNRDELIELIKDHDIVFNAVGPFTRFGTYIMKAVIEGGAHYVDVCDDGDVTLDLLDYDEKARQAGITAIIGMGQTPGLTNMQAKMVAGYLDEIDHLHIAWGTGDPDITALEGTEYYEIAKASKETSTNAQAFKEAMPATWEHMVHSVTGEVPVYMDGEMTTMEADSRGFYINFAEPFTKVPVYVFGHSEPSTLHRYIDINKSSICFGGTLLDSDYREEARGYREPVNPIKEEDWIKWETPKEWQDMGGLDGASCHC